MASSTNLQGILLGFGNPLLDISATVEKSLLDKYELKPANAIMADPKHVPLYDELVKNYQVEYIAGGAAQNSIRAASWLLQTPGAAGYIGCIGNDENGKNMKKAAEGYGVTTHYLVNNEVPTGTCAVLLTDKERSLVANLAAAEKYKKEHFDSAEIQAVVKKAQYFYTTGFVLTHSTETVVALGQHAKETDKHLVLNLSAPFVINFFWDNLSKVIPFADVIICNEDEAANLGQKMNWGADLSEIAKHLQQYAKENTSRKRIVVFTQGAKETIVCTEQGISKHPVIELKKEQLVDTNGAGDSFVGGFLSQYVQNKSLEECVRAGHYCAWECVQRSGATYPAKPNFH
eukprot:TRINITY_DN1637_c0_g1_i1.p1 TRINITY_DN1637_c0_g1~~TRINITY_DN1637_c0_g1_i1.p1  ORF type:complete len:358 (+),score=110.85 TRINITY_DN1637_c0_g1_i1:41-1075(+)